MALRASPLGAATLSFVLPGLGEVATGATRRGVLLALPAVALPLALVVAALGGSFDDRTALLDLLLRPEVVAAVVVVDLIALGYHVLSIADAWTIARRRAVRVRRLAVVGLVLLLAATLLVHGAIAAVGLEAEDTLTAMFPGETDENWSIPEPSFEPTEEPSTAPPATPTPGASPSATTSSAPPSPSPSSGPSPTPTPSPVPKWAKDGRLNLLLLGTDAGPDRWLLRTDTIVVLSVDVDSGRAALFGVPRNMTNVPLPPESAGAFADGRFPGMINALYVYAWGHPKSFPGGDARGYRAVAGAVQELIGVRLDGMVAVDLRGFIRLVDALDGLWIDAPERVVDDNYPKADGSGTIRIDFPAGCQHLDGWEALAYARSRHQDSDYGRMRRQQAVLLAIREQVNPVKLVSRIPELLSIAKDDLWTTLKRSEIAGMGRLAAHVDAGSVKRVLFVPTRYPAELTDAELAQIHRVVKQVFAGKPPAATASPGHGTHACP